MIIDRTALMIIRVWVEEGSSSPLRAQIRIASDVSDGVDRTLTFAASDDVCAAVAAWLSEVLSGVTPR
jgi:hypothetical protein